MKPHGGRVGGMFTERKGESLRKLADNYRPAARPVAESGPVELGAPVSEMFDWGAWVFRRKTAKERAYDRAFSGYETDFKRGARAEAKRKHYRRKKDGEARRRAL